MSIDNTTPLVSVVIPAYNIGQFLRETIASVVKQTYTNWECIVVDDGSTDNTSEVVGQFQIADERVKYIRQENRGVSAARNIGIRNGQGAFILPLDGDDKIGTEYLDRAVNAILKDDSLKVIYCDAAFFGDVTGKWILPSYSYRELLKENMIFSAALYRKSDFEAIGGYDESMKTGFEDWEFWISLLAGGASVYKIPQELFYYRSRKESRNNSLNKDKQRLLRQYIYNKHTDIYHKNFNLSEVIFEWYSESEKLRQAELDKEILKKELIERHRHTMRGFLSHIFRKKSE
jgi:glycosyltransferase involved in cell wall biosynthesis